MELPTGKTILSGIQPSGAVHLGNYLGAIKQWVALQDDNNVFYCIVDQHAIIADYEPKELPGRILDVAATFIAAGLDPEKCTLFVQSQVPAHTELAWLLSTVTPLGELERMTQFKDKSQGAAAKKVSLGLFSYPVLQTADIILYRANTVPVGEDQVQHIELARDIVRRFNNQFGETFVAPEAFVNKNAARIMSLTDPTSKMSKSDQQPKSYVALTDEPEAIRKKIMSAVTETEPVFSFTESGPAVQNLLRIYEALSGESRDAIESTFNGADYKTFKEALAELVVTTLTPLQERYRDVRADEAKLQDILAAGRDHAATVANQTLAEAREKMGLR